MLADLENFLVIIDKWLWGKWLVFVLLALGILYTFANGFIQIRHFNFIMKKTLVSAFKERNVNKGEGSISSFKAMMITLAGNVGGGNVVGIATAIAAGGMGACFWMWVAAFFGMALKYGEIVLSQMYRGKDEHGNLLGGPMYYIKSGLKIEWLGSLVAFLMCIKVIGANFVQSNTIASILNINYNINKTLTGIILIILLMGITLGGIQKLATIATQLVPLMSIFYFTAGILVILLNIKQVPAVFAEIFELAFSTKAAASGASGYIIARAMQYGITRGMYSNEAGEGTGPFAHGTAIVEHPCEEGIMGVTEVFIDTMIICTITALVVGVTGIHQTGAKPTVMAINAFGTVWPPLKHIATFALIIFCFTTLMGHWFKASISLTYIFGSKILNVVKYIFPFLCIIGATTKINVVWTLQDIAMGLLVIPNLLALIVLFPQVRRKTKEYFTNPKYYPNAKDAKEK